MGVIVWCREGWRERNTKGTSSWKQMGTIPLPRLEGKGKEVSPKKFSVVGEKNWEIAFPVEWLQWLGGDYSATSHECRS